MVKNVQYDNNGNVIKQPFEIKIAGFTFGKKSIYMLLVLMFIVAILMVKDSMQKKKEEAEAEAAALAAAEALKDLDFSGTSEEYDFHNEMQKNLTKQYGEAPEGFEWDYVGNLVAIGDDASATAEDVIYMYLRALSILDFSTASKYSDNSDIISSYESYYSDYGGITDYYSNFLRKQFKKSLTSIEINGVTDIAVFADGTEYITLSLNILDLTDKDFWQDDKDSLWKDLRVYKETEEDNVKLEQHVYDYIYSKYEDGTIGKRPVTVELVVTKLNGGGWLVSGDSELNAMLRYENGVDVAQYILDDFDSWYQETILEEQINRLESMNDDIGEDAEVVSETEESEE